MTPRIYIACLAAYNAGHLHGAWMDLGEDVEEEDIWDAINHVLATSPIPNAEEWAIHDREYLPNMGENPIVADLATMGALVDEYGKLAISVYDDVSNVEECAGMLPELRGPFGSAEDAAAFDLEMQHDNLMQSVKMWARTYRHIPGTRETVIAIERNLNRVGPDMVEWNCAHNTYEGHDDEGRRAVWVSDL